MQSDSPTKSCDGWIITAFNHGKYV